MFKHLAWLFLTGAAVLGTLLLAGAAVVERTSPEYFSQPTATLLK